MIELNVEMSSDRNDYLVGLRRVFDAHLFAVLGRRRTPADLAVPDLGSARAPGRSPQRIVETDTEDDVVAHRFAAHPDHPLASCLHVTPVIHQRAGPVVEIQREEVAPNGKGAFDRRGCLARSL